VVAETTITDLNFNRGLMNGKGCYDNLFICDTAGAAPFNDIMPETRIYTTMPTAAGDLTEFTPSGNPNNFENVNNIIAAPAPTQWNQSAVVGQRDTFQYPAVVFAGIPSVKIVQAHMVGSKSDAGARTIQLLVRDGGVNTDIGGIQNLNNNPSWTGFEADMLVDPITGLPWDLSDVSNYQFGYELKS
jgi:hypothetical protein